MQAVFSWVKGIAFYLILLTVVSHLVPGKKYEKYVRLFSGMILILLVIRPVTAVLDKEGSFDMRVAQRFQKEGESEKAFLKELEVFQEEETKEQFEAQMQLCCGQQALSIGLEITQFQVTFRKENRTIVPQTISIEVKEASSQNDNSGEDTDIQQIKIRDVVIGEKESDNAQKNEKLIQLQNMIANYYGMQNEQVEIRGK